MDSKTVVTKETKNKIHVDFDGKLTLKERILYKLKTSNTWMKVIVNIFRFVLMLGVSYVIIFPFVSKIANSFMTLDDIVDATVSLIPKNFTFDNYKYIFLENDYMTAFGNTLLLSSTTALIQTFVSCLVGYGLAKFKFKGNNFVFVLVVVIMIIPHSTLELAMRDFFTKFDLLLPASMDQSTKGIIELIAGTRPSIRDTMAPFYVLSIGGLAFKNGLYIYLMRQFFKGVPDELEESAYVDGSGTFRTFLQIILPLSIPMMITVFLFSFSWSWTDVFYRDVFFEGLNAPWMLSNLIEKVPPTLNMVNNQAMPLYRIAIQNTAGLMIIAPLVIMYLFCQRYLVQGIERSGLVG
ncbi:MAG: carbohydrate ABC transporter permease [Clostridia bacterium]|nr:carbohydrate ABC transporter permease [Clostridia bacterium]